MKIRRLKKFTLMLAATLLASGFAACSDDDDNDGGSDNNDTLLQNAVTAFVNHTVVPTYKNLADESIVLVSLCEEMEAAYGNGERLDSLAAKAGEAWMEARRHWELSEAFLYGAATKYGIDPHIDSWPLNYDQLAATLANSAIMSQMSDEYVVSNLGSGLLGFHALEYMLFDNGSSRDAGRLTREELVYTAAVARDLRNHCILLEAAWSGDIGEPKSEWLSNAEMEPDDNFGDYMTHAGEPGSIYKSHLAAAQQIVQGCIDIADEVANTKIFSAYQGGEEDYIESPHSKNSQKDFADNIRSIQNAYCGSQAGDASVSDCIKRSDATLDSEVRAAIAAAIAAIESAKGPFVDHIKDPSWGAAIEATNRLRDKLSEAMNEL